MSRGNGPERKPPRNLTCRGCRAYDVGRLVLTADGALRCERCAAKRGHVPQTPAAPEPPARS